MSLRRLRPPDKRKFLLLRRVTGDSMVPQAKEGDWVLASGWFWRLRPQDVVIIQHDGMEKLKRVAVTTGDRVFVLGDNTDASTDSRHFGWLKTSAIIAKVIWPRPIIQGGSTYRD